MVRPSDSGSIPEKWVKHLTTSLKHLKKLAAQWDMAKGEVVNIVVNMQRHDGRVDELRVM